MSGDDTEEPKSNVRSIYWARKKKELSPDEETKETPESKSLQQAMDENYNKKARMKADRDLANKDVIRDYKLDKDKGKKK